MMRRTSWLVGCLVLTTALSGCSGPGTEHPDKPVAPQAAVEQTSAADPSDPVLRAVAVAREIEADPEDLDAILKRHGLTAEAFEDLLYEISSDPEQSKAYNTALDLSP